MNAFHALLLLVVGFGAAAAPTPPAPDEGGPVYPEDRDVGGGPRDAPWSGTIADRGEPGERLVLTGTVFGSDDKPREGVTVYAYHTDERGFYRSKPWGRPRLRGWVRTNAEGRYEFHTIKPGPYPSAAGSPAFCRWSGSQTALGAACATYGFPRVGERRRS